MTELNGPDFAMWKRDPVTISLVQAIGQLLESVEEEMLSDAVLLGDNVALILNRLVGKREVLVDFLTLCEGK